VNPETDSKYALIGWARTPSPATTNGIAPNTGTSTHVRATTRNPSRGLASSRPVATNWRRTPTAAVAAPAITNGQTGSPYTRAIRVGKRYAGER
jgi:hypothetical protein